MNITDGIERTVATMDEEECTLNAARLMTEKMIGSVVVTSHSRIIGVFSERELMMRVVGKGRDPARVKLREVMQSDNLKVTADTSCEDALEHMRQNRCRHLLVFDQDKFIGLISLRDIVLLTLKEKDGLIHQLEQYISAS